MKQAEKQYKVNRRGRVLIDASRKGNIVIIDNLDNKKMRKVALKRPEIELKEIMDDTLKTYYAK